MVLVGVTGFGPFPGVPDNASAHAVGLLERGSSGASKVVSSVLPVEFDGVGVALEDHFERVGPEPDLLLALGVHRGSELRLERRARRRTTSTKPDAAGRVGAGDDLDPAWPEVLETSVDLGRAAAALALTEGPAVIQSDDAGGYLCERVCYLTLRRAAELGVPGLFLHVPGVERANPKELVAPVQALIRELVG